MGSLYLAAFQLKTERKDILIQSHNKGSNALQQPPISHKSSLLGCNGSPCFGSTSLYENSSTQSWPASFRVGRLAQKLFPTSRKCRAAAQARTEGGLRAGPRRRCALSPAPCEFCKRWIGASSADFGALAANPLRT